MGGFNQSTQTICKKQTIKHSDYAEFNEVLNSLKILIYDFESGKQR